MKIWIDIANAPHVTFFRPVVAQLRSRGHDVFVSVHDRGQTLPLALGVWPDAEIVGSGYRRSILDKGLAVSSRARKLRRFAQGRRPDLVICHNSYPQLLAARMLRIPSLTIMDYEHQPANHLAFRLASRVVVPHAIPPKALRRFGVRTAQLVRYEGVKEEIALSTFRPNPSFRRAIGINEEEPLVTLRPPAQGALYHRHGNDLFDVVIASVTKSGAAVLLSPRTRSQAKQFAGTSGLRVLDEPVSGPDLLFHSDLVVGAGGTMTREAAVLGTPTVSVFAGRPAAVDHWLERQGKLRIARAPSDVREIRIERIRDRNWVPDESVVVDFVTLLLKVSDELR